MVNTKNSMRQRISQSAKYANNAKWGKDIMNMLIPDFFTNTSYVKEYNKDLENYRLYNNEITQEDFNRVCNPLGIDMGQYDQEVMPYNKTYTKVDVLLGEESKRGDNYVVTLLNEKAIQEKDKEILGLYTQFVKSKIESAQEEAKAKTEGMSEQEIEQLMKEIEIAETPDDLEITTFLSQKEILGNSILKYGQYDQNIKEKKNDGFKHALLSDKEFAYVGLKYGEPTIKLLNPLTMFYQKNPDVKFIQDGDWAGHRTQMSITSILEMYGHQMTKAEIKKLEDRLFGTGGQKTYKESLELDRENTLTNRHLRQFRVGEFIDSDNIGSYGGGSNNRLSKGGFANEMLWVTHLEWVSQRKVTFVTYIDEYGEEQERMEDESFEIPKEATKVEFINSFGEKDERMEWTDEEDMRVTAWTAWIRRVWEGTRIDDIGEGIFINVREKPNQYTSIDNPFKCKLGYHGLVYNNMNADYISLMSRMKPYQFLYFVAMHEIKNLIARNKGIIPNIDTAKLDPKLGKKLGKDPVEMTLFWLNEGLNIYNSMGNQEGGASIPPNTPQPDSTNLDNTPGILNLIQILSWLDLQIGEASGVSKQREGGIAPREAVANAQQNITQQSHITEHYFQKHNELWRNIMDSYLLTAQVAWEGKSLTKQFVLSDGSLQALKIDDNSFDNADFGIFVANSGQTKLFFEDLRNLALPALQNDNSLTDIAKILKAISDGTSTEEVTRMLQISEDKRNKAAQQEQEAQLKHTEKMQQLEIAHREDVQAHEMELVVFEKEYERETQLLVEAAKAAGSNLNQDVDQDGMPDYMEIVKFQSDANIKAAEMKQRQKEHDDNLKIKKEELKVKKSSANKTK